MRVNDGETLICENVPMTETQTLFLQFAAAVLLINLFAFAAFAWDKSAARRGAWRIRESTLLWLAMIGGFPGAIAAQRMLRHKTRKEPFRTQLYAIAGMETVIGLALAIPQSRHLLLDLLRQAAA